MKPTQPARWVIKIQKIPLKHDLYQNKVVNLPFHNMIKITQLKK